MGTVKTMAREYEAMIAKRNGTKGDPLSGQELSDPLAKPKGASEGAGFQVFCQTPSGPVAVGDLTPKTTVAELQTKVAEKSGVPADSSYLLHGGKPLRGAGTLADFGIGDLSTLVLHTRVLGGYGER